MSQPKPQHQQSQMPQGQQSSPDRKPIPVGVVQFVQPGQDGPGMSMNSSLTSKQKAPRGSKHRIEFRPAMRSFRLVYEASDGSSRVFYVPEHRVASWEPLEE